MNLSNEPTIDDVSFLGDPIPVEVMRTLPIIPLVSIRSLQSILQLVVQYMQGDALQGDLGLNTVESQNRLLAFQERSRRAETQLNAQLETELMEALERQEEKLKQQHGNRRLKPKQTKDELEHIQAAQQSTGLFPVLFTGLFILLREAVRQRMKRDDLLEQLTWMGLSEQVVQLLVQVFDKKRDEFIEKSQSATSWFNRLVGVRWRVDVTISNSVMNRVFKPSLLMQFTLSDGKIRTMEVSMEQFHQLRIQVASVLNDMNQLESHPIMHIRE